MLGLLCASLPTLPGWSLVCAFGRLVCDTCPRVASHCSPLRWVSSCSWLIMAHHAVRGTGAPYAHEGEIPWTSGHGTHGSLEPRIKPLSRAANGHHLICNLVELNPGKAGWPFHFHTAEEEVNASTSLKSQSASGAKSVSAKPLGAAAMLDR